MKEPVEATVALTKESPKKTPILPDNAPSPRHTSFDSPQKLIGEQLQDEEIDKIMLASGPDEFSENVFMFSEPFKRARVLSSSDSDD